jgi:hypothetical protein
LPERQTQTTLSVPVAYFCWWGETQLQQQKEFENSKHSMNEKNGPLSLQMGQVTFAVDDLIHGNKY